jgi:hypothetical protein
MSGCKAPLPSPKRLRAGRRNPEAQKLTDEAYLDVRRNDEGRGKRRRWAFFSSLLDFQCVAMFKIYALLID